MVKDYNKTILVVEDEEALRKAMSDKLTREGFKVLEAKDGEEGLETALKEHPDLTLLDIMMPKMDGLTVLSNLREDEWGKTAQVIIMTNLSESEKVSEAVVNGVYEYLVKSDVPLAEVVQKIKAKLGITD